MLFTCTGGRKVLAGTTGRADGLKGTAERQRRQPTRGDCVQSGGLAAERKDAPSGTRPPIRARMRTPGLQTHPLAGDDARRHLGSTGSACCSQCHGEGKGGPSLKAGQDHGSLGSRSSPAEPVKASAHLQRTSASHLRRRQAWAAEPILTPGGAAGRRADGPFPRPCVRDPDLRARIRRKRPSTVTGRAWLGSSPALRTRLGSIFPATSENQLDLRPIHR